MEIEASPKELDTEFSFAELEIVWVVKLVIVMSKFEFPKREIIWPQSHVKNRPHNFRGPYRKCN